VLRAMLRRWARRGWTDAGREAKLAS